MDGFAGPTCDVDMRQTGSLPEFSSHPTTGTTGYQIPHGLPMYEPPMFVPGMSRPSNDNFRGMCNGLC